MIEPMTRVQTPMSRLDVAGRRLGSIGGLAVAAVMFIASAGCQPKATAAPDAGAAPVRADGGEIEDPETGLDDGSDGLDEDDSGDVEPAEPDLAAVDSVAGVPTQVISFDESDPNPGPTDRVESQPGRPKSGSLLTPDVIGGPK